MMKKLKKYLVGLGLFIGAVTAAQAATISISGCSLTDGADRILFYDESLGDCAGLSESTGIQITGTNLSVKTQMSLTGDASGIKLSGDATTPGNSKYYGTNGGGTKGYFDLPSSAVWGSITGTLSDQTDLQTALNAKLNTADADETAQDAVGAMVNSTLTYTDATPLLGINLDKDFIVGDAWTGRMWFDNADGYAININPSQDWTVGGVEIMEIGDSLFTGTLLFRWDASVVSGGAFTFEGNATGYKNIKANDIYGAAGNYSGIVATHTGANWDAGADVYLAKAGYGATNGAMNLVWQNSIFNLRDDLGDYKPLRVESLTASSVSVEDVFLGDNALIYSGGIMYSGPASQIRNDLGFYYDSTNNRMSVASNTLTPQSKIHIDSGNATASAIKLTAGTTTGQTSTDGVELGISTTGAGEIRQRENAAINFFTNNTANWSIGATGHLTATDNTFDIGQSGATRPRNVYVGTDVIAGGLVTAGTEVRAGTNVQAAATGQLYWSGRTILTAPADGTMLATNTAGTAFTRFMLGGTTSSFPSIKRNGTGIDLRLADDSAYANLAAGSLTSSTLTSGRLALVSTSGLLTDDADFTHSGGDTLIVTKLTSNAIAHPIPAAKTANYTTTASDYTILVNPNGATRTITLHTDGADGQEIFIKKITDISGYQVILSGTIDGSASFTINNINEGVKLQWKSSTSTWYVTGYYPG